MKKIYFILKPFPLYLDAFCLPWSPAAHAHTHTHTHTHARTQAKAPGMRARNGKHTHTQETTISELYLICIWIWICPLHLGLNLDFEFDDVLHLDFCALCCLLTLYPLWVFIGWPHGVTLSHCGFRIQRSMLKSVWGLVQVLPISASTTYHLHP